MTINQRMPVSARTVTAVYAPVTTVRLRAMVRGCGERALIARDARAAQRVRARIEPLTEAAVLSSRDLRHHVGLARTSEDRDCGRYWPIWTWTVDALHRARRSGEYDALNPAVACEC